MSSHQQKEKPSRANPLSIEPFDDPKISGFKNLPALEDRDAKMILFFGIGLLVTLAVIVLNVPTGRLPNIFFDPWTENYLNTGDFSFLVAWALLFVFTASIWYKQYGYYFFSGKGKEGIFVNLFKQVNYRERTFDVILAFSGALLFPATVYPMCWFLLLSTYSIFVALRCFFTASRKGYARKLRQRSKKVPFWYDEFEQSMYERYKERIGEPKHVLIGWVVTHVFIAAYSFTAFLVLLLTFELVSIMRILVFAILLILAIILYFKLGHTTYEWSERLCDD